MCGWFSLPVDVGRRKGWLKWPLYQSLIQPTRGIDRKVRAKVVKRGVGEAVRRSLRGVCVWGGGG